jgi:hypothetical protein
MPSSPTFCQSPVQRDAIQHLGTKMGFKYHNVLSSMCVGLGFDSKCQCEKVAYNNLQATKFSPYQQEE